MTNSAPQIVINGGNTALGSLSDASLLLVSGTLGFTDADHLDQHAVTATLRGTSAPGGIPLGTLNVLRASDSQAGATGSLQWTYTVNAAKYAALAAGVQVIDAFNINVDDGNGGIATRSVRITLTGSNDAPTISASTYAPDGRSGTVFFNDPDAGDTHLVTVAGKNGAATFGNLATSVDETGKIAWTYSAAGEAALTDGQTKTDVFTLTLNDQHAGGTISKDITVTVVGKNDAPIISADTQSDAMHGRLVYADPEADAVTVSVQNIDGHAGVLSTDTSVAGRADWTYTPDASLAAGQTRTDHYSITLTDSHGATTVKNLSFAQIGVNDAPTLTKGAGDADALTLTTGQSTVAGTLTAADIDNGDVLSVSVAGKSNPYGTVKATLNSGTINYVYTAAKDSPGTGTDLFTLTVTDKAGATASRDVSIDLNGGNVAPTMVSSNILRLEEDAVGTPSLSADGLKLGIRSSTGAQIFDAATGTVQTAQNSSTGNGAVIAPGGQALTWWQPAVTSTAAGVNGGWTPASLPGLVFWLDAKAIGQSDGSAVSAWNDLSGNGYNFTQATAANQPTYNATGLNGNPTVTFNGITNYLSLASLPSSVAFTGGVSSFVVGAFDAIESNSRLFDI